MAFDDLIRTGVALADSLTASLQATVTHKAWIGQDEFGKASYADPVARAAIVEKEVKLRRTTDGRTLLTTARIMFLRPVPPNGTAGRQEPIDPQDQFVLPDGSLDPIVATGGLIDPDSGRGYYNEVWLGEDS